MSLHRPVSLVFLAIAPLFCGCSGAGDDLPKGLIHRAAVRLEPRVLDSFVGTYQLPSGALFPVVRDGNRLLGGTPPHELLPQTTRRFSSNRLPGELHFDVSDGRVIRMNHRLAKRDHWAERVDPEMTADPTQLVDAGGHRLRMLVSGQGQPTIVLEDGFGAGVDLQSAFQARLAQLTRVVTYDHAGTGGSDPGPRPRNAQQVARELRRALASAELQPPFVLIGGSIGAEYIRVFAHEFPDDVAGLVMLDPAPDWDELLDWARQHAPARVEMYRRVHGEADRGMTALMRHQEQGRQAEWSCLAETRRLAQEALPPATLPVVQITGAAGRQASFAMDDKFRFFDAWLDRYIPHSRHIIAPHSGHAVEFTDTDLVIEEVQRMLKNIRGHETGVPSLKPSP
jgi:pimeloyl-ACP methyl ester carboxylesterase